MLIRELKIEGACNVQFALDPFSFDYYVIDTGKVYGVKCFYIQPDGTVVEDTYEE